MTSGSVGAFRTEVAVRRSIALLLAVSMLTVGAPATGLAQAPGSTGTIAGEAVDAGGRGLPGLRVELVQAGVVVQTTTTGLSGAYAFTNVPAGDYVVRVVVNEMPAGIRVSLAPGGRVADATIVVPSAVAPSNPPIIALLAALGPVFGTIVAAAVVATVVTTVVVVTGS